MNTVPIVLAAVMPLALLLCFAFAPVGERLRRILPLASVPPLLVAFGPDANLQLPDVLLGAQLRVDGIGRSVLLLVGVAWSAAAWFAVDKVHERFRAFAIFWLATLAGLVIATLAGDLATFYTGYVVMTLASYGLIVHERSAEATRAARIYLVLAMAGEALILSGLLLIGARVGNAELALLPQALQGTDATLVAALLLGGFGVKIGLVPMHVWLPLAHPVAPVPASAILSGVLVKAGLLGALRMAPADAFATVDGSAAAAQLALLAIGLYTALHGAAVGVAQQRLKTVLAYSTVSQMGLLACALALALAPGAERGGPLLTLFVLHHGLNKAALFLAAGCSPGASWQRLALLVVPALSIAGLPFTTGALTKSALKSSLSESPLGIAAGPLLTLSAIATALLMLRVFQIARSASAADAKGEEAARASPPRVHPAWVLLVVAGATVPWLWAVRDGLAYWPDIGGAWDALWPALLAAALLLGWRRIGRPMAWQVPEGDLLWPALAASRMLASLLRRLLQTIREGADRLARWRRSTLARARRLAALAQRLESGISTLPVAGVLLLSMTAMMWWALR